MNIAVRPLSFHPLLDLCIAADVRYVVVENKQKHEEEAQASTGNKIVNPATSTQGQVNLGDGEPRPHG